MGAAEREPLWDVPTLAEHLKCSQWKARQLMLKLPHIRIGKLLRLDPRVLDRFNMRGGDEWLTGSGSEERPTGVGDSTLTAGAGKRARSSAKDAPPNSPLEKSPGDTPPTRSALAPRKSRLRRPLKRF